MAKDRRYSISKNWDRYLWLENMKKTSANGLDRIRDGKAAYFMYSAIDGSVNEQEWGRLKLEVQCDREAVYIIHVFALDDTCFLRKGIITKIDDFLADETVDILIKRQFMAQVGEVKRVNRDDILLYSLKGRYLWIFVEIQGMGNFSCQNIVLDAVGDNFMATFPEIYQERDSFFHRFLSVMSSEYNDFQRGIDCKQDFLDIDKAPLELLEQYASWFGFNINGGFLTEDKLRLFMHNIAFLTKRKGTKEALEKVVEIVLDEKPSIVERNLMVENDMATEVTVLNELYGDSPFDVLILTTVALKDEEKKHLLGFLEQFKPVRCNMDVIFLKTNGELDNYTYLGVNAKLSDAENAVLDNGTELDQMLVLE